MQKTFLAGIHNGSTVGTRWSDAWVYRFNLFRNKPVYILRFVWSGRTKFCIYFSFGLALQTRVSARKRTTLTEQTTITRLARISRELLGSNWIVAIVVHLNRFVSSLSNCTFRTPHVYVIFKRVEIISTPSSFVVSHRRTIAPFGFAWNRQQLTFKQVFVVELGKQKAYKQISSKNVLLKTIPPLLYYNIYTIIAMAVTVVYRIRFYKGYDSYVTQFKFIWRNFLGIQINIVINPLKTLEFHVNRWKTEVRLKLNQSTTPCFFTFKNLK